MGVPESLKQTLAQVIAYYTQDATVLSHRDVPGEAVSHGCSNLEEVTSKEPAIPPADSSIFVPTIINTDFFCEAEGRKVVTLLRNWEGDKRQEEYQQVALRMAKKVSALPRRKTSASRLKRLTYGGTLWTRLRYYECQIDQISVIRSGIMLELRYPGRAVSEDRTRL